MPPTCVFTLAPCCTNSWTMSVCPLPAATRRGIWSTEPPEEGYVCVCVCMCVCRCMCVCVCVCVCGGHFIQARNDSAVYTYQSITNINLRLLLTLAPYLSSASANSALPSSHARTSAGVGQYLSTITFGSTAPVSNRLLWQWQLSAINTHKSTSQAIMSNSGHMTFLLIMLATVLKCISKL